MDVRSIAVKWTFEGEPEYFGPHVETAQDALTKIMVVARKHWPCAFVSGQWTPLDPRSRLMPERWQARGTLCEYCALRAQPGQGDTLIAFLVRASQAERII